MKSFSGIILGAFVLFILIAVTLFATSKGSNAAIKNNVTIWGTIEKGVVENLVDSLVKSDESFKLINYKEIPETEFDMKLLEALASGVGPDIFMLPQSSILKHKDKIYKIPFSSYPLRTFKDKFIEEGELYLESDGILGIPLIIDPLVMYWNRDIFSREALANPPKNWEEFFSLSQKITKRDSNLNILKSAVPFGEFRNVTNAKEIIASLILQAGDPILVRDGEKLNVVLGLGSNNIVPAKEAVDFFVQFSNPIKSVYTWNRSLPESKKSFLAGDLAIYFGFASELTDLRRKNPNLNFDVASLPENKLGSKGTFGKMYSLAIAKNSKNIATAFTVLISLTSDEALSKLSESTNLPPVSRNLLTARPTGNSYLQVFYDSAILSKAWLDPNTHETDAIFQEMIESIISGRVQTAAALSTANSGIRDLLTK